MMIVNIINIMDVIKRHFKTCEAEDVCVCVIILYFCMAEVIAVVSISCCVGGREGEREEAPGFFKYMVHRAITAIC